MFVLIVLAIAAVFGVERIKVDDSLSQLFRSDTAEFKQYEEVTRRFPSSEFDVLVVVEGKTLLQRVSLEKLRDVVTSLQLIAGRGASFRCFRHRQPRKRADSGALFPEELPERRAYDKLVERVMSNEVIAQAAVGRR